MRRNDWKNGQKEFAKEASEECAMNERIGEPVLQRLDRLESENRRLKLLGGLVLLGVAAVGLMGQASKMVEVVEAKRFILRDSTGRNRGGLTVTNDSPILYFRDREGHTRAVLGVGENGDPSLELTDGDLNSGVELMVRSHGVIGLQIHGKHKMPRLGLQLMADGRPILSLADENGKNRAEMSVLSNDTPALKFYDYDKGHDTDPKFLAWMGVSQHGSVTLSLTDRREQSEAQLSVPEGGLPRLRFISRDGRTIWRAP